MTEDEASTKWCPFARTVTITDGEVVPGTSGNRHHYDDDVVYSDHPNNCIGSQCMAWRWKQEGIEHGEPIYNDTYGHCGLASK